MKHVRNFRPFFRELRNMEFIKDYDSVAGGGRCIGWKKKFGEKVGDRELTVQLNDDGYHRVSHWKKTEYGYAGSIEREGLPTDFITLEQMFRAIIRELTK